MNSPSYWLKKPSPMAAPKLAMAGKQRRISRNDAAERAGFASDARDESHVSLPSSVNGSAFEAGRIARVLGRLGQLLDVGLGIVEGDDGLALVETYVGLAHALNGKRVLDVIGQEAQVMPARTA
ncbi:hypothetical protein BANRA_05705 [Klebsiella pneumoniae]|nr:hypothetical protein BANRA_05705 [Klebsiella pneumoniae]